MSCILFMLAIFLIGSKSICYKGFITRFVHLASLRDTSSARLQKLGEFSLSLVIVFTAVSNPHRSHVFSSSLSIMSFWAQKDEKARHTESPVGLFFVQELQATSFSQRALVT